MPGILGIFFSLQEKGEIETVTESWYTIQYTLFISHMVSKLPTNAYFYSLNLKYKSHEWKIRGPNQDS